jgi:hypothetical protein
MSAMEKPHQPWTYYTKWEPKFVLAKKVDGR